jgi:hypothetical protein
MISMRVEFEMGAGFEVTDEPGELGAGTGFLSAAAESANVKTVVPIRTNRASEWEFMTHQGASSQSPKA